MEPILANMFACLVWFPTIMFCRSERVIRADGRGRYVLYSTGQIFDTALPRETSMFSRKPHENTTLTEYSGFGGLQVSMVDLLPPPHQETNQKSQEGEFKSGGACVPSQLLLNCRPIVLFQIWASLGLLQRRSRRLPTAQLRM